MSDPPFPPIVVDDVHKRFEIPREKVSTLKERALHPFKRVQTDALHALRGVSFQVRPGEFFGIVGRNGSGKSTLLKCLAGIYGVDRGGIYVNGRMSTFIELGVGFNPDLPARDNALLNGTMLGLSPREARARLDSVIEFAELHDFVDLKIKNYSSGMLVRLAFAVMIHVDADILLIDEVLAVGDAAFQQKCFDEFERIRAGGATVLFVTHDMSAVRRFCDRALLLERGRPVQLGDPESVGNRYLELNFSDQARLEEAEAAERESGAGGTPALGAARRRRLGAGRLSGSDAETLVSSASIGPLGPEPVERSVPEAIGLPETGSIGPLGPEPVEPSVPEAIGLPETGSIGPHRSDSIAQARSLPMHLPHRDSPRRSISAPAGAANAHQGDEAAEILSAWFEDEQGEAVDVLRPRSTCSVAVQVRCQRDLHMPIFAVSLENGHGDRVFTATNVESDSARDSFAAGELVTFRVCFTNVLAPDRYHLTVSVASEEGAWHDRRERMISVVVAGTRSSDALVELPYEFVLQRGSPQPALPTERR